MQRVLLLINPHARRGKQYFAEAVHQLQQFGLSVVEEVPEKPQDLPTLIRRYAHCVDLAIVGGGDGTLNAAIQGLVETQLPLGVLPLGTANDLARTLGVPSVLSEACQAIATGKIRYIDLGWVNGKYFFNVASMGLSVKVTQKLNPETKRRWGVFAYPAVALQVLRQAHPFQAEIRINGDSIPVKAVQIAIGNGRYYGGGLVIIHDATISDRRLDLYSLETRHWWQILGLVPSLMLGRYPERWVRVLHGTEIEVVTTEPLEINTDGEITTCTPAQFRVIPKALAVVVPKDS